MRTVNFVKAKLKSTCTASLLIGLLAKSFAQAHVTLLDPMARTSDNDLTMDPCGGKPAGPSVATYTAGTNIKITIDLFVQHRPSLQAVISYDIFATRTELAMISTSGEGIYKMIIRLPIQPLGSAVLQVTNGNYVSCADITLSDSVPFSINAGSCTFQRFGHVVQADHLESFYRLARGIGRRHQGAGKSVAGRFLQALLAVGYWPDFTGQTHLPEAD